MEKIFKIKADGMTCNSCEKIIRKQALGIDGVKKCEIDYATQEGIITFDSEKTNIDDILDKIEEKGYECSILDDSVKVVDSPKMPNQKNSSGVLNKKTALVFAVFGILIAGFFFLELTGAIPYPQITSNMSYTLLFILGLFTGFHCIAMCGGFVVSYTAKNAQAGASSNISHLQYGLGKTISYTLIGAVFGLFGSIVAFTPLMRGVAGILAGLFLLLFGLKMLNIIPALRKIQFKTPKFIDKFVHKESEKDLSPLKIGLLNGLMIACGPLLAVYIMAAGTGSMIEGAKILFVFALGTLPVMLGFGYFTSFISSKMTQKILKFSGVFVIILGILMLNNGLALTGTGYDFNSILGIGSIGGNINSGGAPIIKNGYQEIRMDVLRSGWSPNKFVLKTGVPVKWIINGKELTGCNNAIQVPKLGLKFDIKQGEQVIEFTPTEAGTIPWSCWMGMLQGTFIVKDNIDLSNNADVQIALNNAQVPAGGSCGGGGGCGCAAR